MKTNLLIDPLPETVTVDGREFSIYSDFRTAILFELLIADDTVAHDEKLVLALQLYYGEEIPSNADEAINVILEFYSCGKKRKDGGASQKKSFRSPVYSFEYDDKLIYAAFYDQYGVDLNEVEYLHWWKFKAMFDGLKSDNEIVKIMSYRAIDLSTIKDKNERNRIAHLKAIYAIPNTMSFEEKVSAAGAIFGGGLS